MRAVLLLAVGLGALRLALLDLLLNVAVHLLRLAHVHVVFVIARARDDFRAVAKEDDTAATPTEQARALEAAVAAKTWQPTAVRTFFAGREE